MYIITCILQSLVFVKALLQWLHWKDFFPQSTIRTRKYFSLVWISICLFNEVLYENLWSHSVQKKGFSTLWHCKWSINSSFEQRFDYKTNKVRNYFSHYYLPFLMISEFTLFSDIEYWTLPAIYIIWSIHKIYLIALNWICFRNDNVSNFRIW